MKRYATIVLLVLVLGGALGYFFYTYWRNTQTRPLEDALLQNTSFYLSTPDALEIFPSFRNMPYGAEVYSLPVFARLESQLAAFDSVLRATGYTLGGTPLIASLYATGAEQYDWLFLVDGSNTDAETLLGKLTGIAGAKVSKRIYRDETVLDIVMPGMELAFSCATLNGILMGSFSAFLVEEGIVQLKDKDPLEETDPRFRKIHGMAGKEASLSLFLNPAQFKFLGKQFIDEQRSPLLSHLSSFSSWFALDVSFRNSGILLGGYALPDSSGILSTFNQGALQEFGFDKVLPANTTFFAAQELVLDLETAAGSAAVYLNGWLSPFACYGLLEPLDQDYSSEWFLTMPVLDEEMARQSLQEMARVNATEAAFSDELLEIRIGRLTNDSALVQSLGLAEWLPLNNPYFAVTKGHVFFANDLNTLKEILTKATTGLTLSSSPAYVGYAQEVANSNNLYIYLNPARMGELLPAVLLGEVIKGSGYKSFSPVGLQFNYDEGVFFTIALIQYREGGPIMEDTDTTTTDVPASDVLAWRLPLDGKLSGKPYLVTNHNTGELEVLVQDALGNIYLINKAGKILWKKRLEGTIIGDIYQIDLYKNGKLQYIFNTQQKLHLVDRNGNNVEQFPIALAAKAVNGLFLTDDGKKNYQYFVACDNYKVYGYTANGKPLQGWNPKPRVGTIPYPIQYTTANGKEYFILTNVDGTLLYYNRNGERHEKPIRLEATFKQPFCIHEQGKTFTLINASESNILFTINAKGEVKETKDGLPAYYNFACAGADSTLQYIFVAGDKVTFTSPKLETTATFTPKQTLDLPAQIFKTPDGTVVGLTSTTGNEIYLVTLTGQSIPGSPLKGNTAMAVGKLFDEGTAIIVGNADGNLNAYRLP